MYPAPQNTVASDRLGYTPNTPRETGGGGAHRCLLSFLFALSPLSTECTPQQVFEPSRKLSSVMKLAENCLKVGLSDFLGLTFTYNFIAYN
jgi:hypothetical protein